MGLDKYTYIFKPVKGFWFTRLLLDDVSSKVGCFSTSLDLGLSTRTICINRGLLVVENTEIPINELYPSEEDRVVIYEQESGEIYELVRSTASGFYKLKSIGPFLPPTIEINGIHMHRIVGIDPWSDSLTKIKAARVGKGDRVLDTCTGLGYTAIASVKKGAREVVTFEIDESVLWIAERNPWSRGLASDRIKLLHGDVTTLIHELPDSYFTRIIHDPPRFTKSTGDLYSLEFYRELYRVIRKMGVLFHYTGEPRLHGPSIIKGIAERLRIAGFRVLGFDKSALGFIAVKY